MIKEAKISVVFTSYNHGKYLRQALDSILNQTFADFELIIIDDCSTDGSQAILKEYAYKDNRIRLVLNTVNSGSYVCSTNQGAALASTPFIIFAQCDDYAEPTQFEKLYNAITNNSVAVAFSRSNMVGEEGEFLGTDLESRDNYFRRVYGRGGVVPKEKAFSSLLKSCMIPNLSAAILRKDVFEQLNGFSKQYLVLADWDFWIRVSEKHDFYYIAEPLNNFRQHNNTIRSTVKEVRQWAERFNMFKGVIERDASHRRSALSNLALGWVLSSYDNMKGWSESRKEIMAMGRELSNRWDYYVVKAVIKMPFVYLGHKFCKLFY